MTSYRLQQFASRSWAVLALTCASWILGTNVAQAVDGVVEINAAAAAAGGITPDDTPGMPVTISMPGSYRLTGDLTVAGVDDLGVDINVPNVTLDLNGFGITGPVVCTTPDETGASLTCTGGSGVGIGVRIVAPRITVKNGQVSGFGNFGISDFGSTGLITIDSMNVTSNGSHGINLNASPDSSVTRSTIALNGGHGAFLTRGSMIQKSIVAMNKTDGVGVGFETVLVRGNIIRANGGGGIVCGAYTDNVILENIADSCGTEIGTNYCDGDTTCP